MIDREALGYARGVLEAVVQDHPPPAPPTSPAMAEPASAFVTLRCEGVLRGCLGDTGFDRPLHEVLRRMTAAAATSDPRFAPIAPAELSTVSIELSLLTPPRPAGRHEIAVGTHGIVVQLDGQRGILLPQVAVECGCDAAGFVALACRKAGLDSEAVHDPDLQILVFEAEVVSE